MNEEFRRAIREHLELRSTVNRYGQRNIDLVSGLAENVEIPETSLTTPPIRVSIRFPPSKRSSAFTRVSPTSTTARSTSLKSRCG